MTTYTVAKELSNLKQELTTILSEKIKKDWIQTAWNGNDLSVKIEKGGSSEFVIGLQPSGDTVTISEVKRKVALFHKPFVGEVEKMIDELMTQIGAKKA